MQDSDTEPRARLRGISKMGHVGAGIDIARADVLIDLVLCVLLPWVFDQLPARVQSVDLSDPSLNQPVLEEIVSGNMNVLLAVVVPFASFVVVELSKPWKLRLDVFQLFAIGLLESCGMYVIGCPTHESPECDVHSQKVPSFRKRFVATAKYCRRYEQRSVRVRPTQQ